MKITYVEGVTPAKWLRAWAAQRPDTPIEAVRVDEGAQFDALRAGTADAAFVRIADDDHVAREREGGALAGLHVVSLYSEQSVAVAPREHEIEAAAAVALGDLDGLPQAPDQPDYRSTIELVATGAGYAIVPQSVARLYARRDVIARTVTDAATTPIALVWPVPVDGPAIQAFVAVVRGRTAASSRGSAETSAQDSNAETPQKQAPKQKSPKQTSSKTPPKSKRKNANSAKGARSQSRRPRRRS